MSGWLVSHRWLSNYIASYLGQCQPQVLVNQNDVGSSRGINHNPGIVWHGMVKLQ